MGLFNRTRNNVSDDEIIHQLYNDYVSVAYNSALLSETRARTRINPDEYIRNDRKIIDVFANAQSMDAELGLDVGTRFREDYAAAAKRGAEDARKQLGPERGADPAFVYSQARENEQLFHVLADCYLLYTLLLSAAEAVSDEEEKASYLETADEIMTFSEYIEIQLAYYPSEGEYAAAHIFDYISENYEDAEEVASYICNDFDGFLRFMDDFLEGKEDMSHLDQIELQESIYDIDRIFADSLNYHEKEAH